jgi:hypothetical protein
MPDLMSFRARDGQMQCELCKSKLAAFDYEILCDREKSKQKGCCCSTCAHNLLEALGQVKMGG